MRFEPPYSRQQQKKFARWHLEKSPSAGIRTPYPRMTSERRNHQATKTCGIARRWLVTFWKLGVLYTIWMKVCYITLGWETHNSRLRCVYHTSGCDVHRWMEFCISHSGEINTVPLMKSSSRLSSMFLVYFWETADEPGGLSPAFFPCKKTDAAALCIVNTVYVIGSGGGSGGGGAGGGGQVAPHRKTCGGKHVFLPPHLRRLGE